MDYGKAIEQECLERGMAELDAEAVGRVADGHVEALTAKHDARVKALQDGLDEIRGAYPFTQASAIARKAIGESLRV